MYLGFLGGSDGKTSPPNVGDPGSIPVLGRSPGGRHGNPLQYSCLENPHGQRSLAGYSPWGHKELDMTERLIHLSILFHSNETSFHSNPKESMPKNVQNNHIIILISHSSKVMPQILQARLQQYMNWELPDVQAEFRKGRGTRDQIANIHWVIEKAREFQKNIGLLLHWLC